MQTGRRAPGPEVGLAIGFLVAVSGVGARIASVAHDHYREWLTPAPGPETVGDYLPDATLIAGVVIGLTLGLKWSLGVVAERWLGGNRAQVGRMTLRRIADAGLCLMVMGGGLIGVGWWFGGFAALNVRPSLGIIGLLDSLPGIPFLVGAVALGTSFIFYRGPVGEWASGELPLTEAEVWGEPEGTDASEGAPRPAPEPADGGSDAAGAKGLAVMTVPSTRRQLWALLRHIRRQEIKSERTGLLLMIDKATARLWQLAAEWRELNRSDREEGP